MRRIRHHGDRRGCAARGLLASGLVLLVGCYSGLSEREAGLGPDEGSGASGADSDGSGGGEDAEPPPTDADGCVLPARRIWKLTPAQVARTVTAMIPEVSDAGLSLAATLPASIGFSNDATGLAMTEPHVFDLLRFANGLADEVMADPGAVHPCLGDGPDADCVASFVEEFATKGFRRPPTAEELDELLALYQAEDVARGPDSALYQVVRAVFMSPQFLYRTELGAPTDEDDVFALTAHERASALSYLLLDGPPDDELLAAAEAGELEQPAGFALQIDRLLASPDKSRGIIKLLQEHLHADQLELLTKDPEVAAGFDTALAAAFAAENRAYLEHVLWQDDSRWPTVLTATYTIIDATLAEIYGVSAPEGEPQRVELPADERAGLMTQVGMMAALSRENTTDPVARGRFVREVLMCQSIPAPPPEVDAVPPPPDESLTKREQLAIHREDPTCAACHDLIDPPGLAFESYDLVGRYRQQDNGKPIDASGELGPGQDGAFVDAVEMMTLIAEDPRAHNCLVDAVYRYVVGHAVEEADACAVEAAQQRFVERDAHVLELVSDIVTTDRFVLRRGGQ